MRKSDEIIMETFHIWQAEDGIRTVIDACLGCGIWEMTYDNADSTIRAELNEHLDRDAGQRPLQSVQPLRIL
jgi:hypothetical protein